MAPDTPSRTGAEERMRTPRGPGGVAAKSRHERSMKLGFDQARRLRVAAVSIAALLQLAIPALATECDRDQFSVFTIDGYVIASSGGGGSRSIDLEQGEEVLDKASSGCVAMVSTDRRLLAISALGGDWTPTPYQLKESPAYKLLVGDLVGVAISDRRVIAYDPRATRVVATNIASQEAVTHWIAGESIAAVATNRRVIGFSVGLNRFAERTLRLKEEIESVNSASDVVTVITGIRILTLRSGSGFWAERNRQLR
ncbi:MAG: hypothetical protein AAEJ52_21990 [Myxococcota bacterium]